jgi:3-hydroxyacyl-CoA dehydrogenase
MTLSKAEEVGGVATVVVGNDTPGLVVNALAVAIIAKAATQRNFMLLLKINAAATQGMEGRGERWPL